MLFDLGMAASHMGNRHPCGGKRTLRESVNSKASGKASLERERRKYTFLSNSVARTQEAAWLKFCKQLCCGWGFRYGKKEYIVSHCLIQEIIIPPVFSVGLR